MIIAMASGSTTQTATGFSVMTSSITRVRNRESTTTLNPQVLSFAAIGFPIAAAVPPPNYGVYNENENEVLDATNNWWDDASGPSHAMNPSGTGNAVSDYVNYNPWLTSEFQYCPECNIVPVGGEVYPIDGDALDSGSAVVL